ncbi:MAG TPA: hypothetical protein VJM07_07870 [Gaiella sp.]|jgi:hypothetical protein|nr:hypothetical protein [Gaiella sp.]
MNASRDWIRPAAGAALVAALVVGAAFLVALAADVLRWDRTMRDDDIAYAAHADASWMPSTLLPAGITRTALGLEDDVELRGAVDQFWKSDPRAPLQVFTDVTRRTAAERRLARLMETEERPERRSVLATLRGAFLLEEARNSPVQRHVFLRRAIEQFERAAELDPGNADAVYNLELALKLLRETGGGTAGSGDRRAPLPSPGSGSSSAGSGF